VWPIHLWVPSRGLQRDVVYLGWPIAPSYMSPNAGVEGRELRGLSQWVQLCTCSPINFRYLTLYLTYTVKNFYEIPGFILTKPSWDCEKSVMRRDDYHIFGPVHRMNISCFEDVKSVPLMEGYFFPGYLRLNFPKGLINEISGNFPGWPREKHCINCHICFQSSNHRNQTKPNIWKGNIKWKKIVIYMYFPIVNSHDYLL
jgi:hypothetical protein